MKLTLVCWPSIRRCHTASKMAPTTQLTEKQWLLIAPLFPWKRPMRVSGRPKALPRDCLEGILWILRTGARWKDLPKHFPSYTTCWRRLRDWTRDGTFQRAWAKLLRKLDGMRRLNWREALADGTFSPSKKGVRGWRHQERQRLEDHAWHRRTWFADRGTGDTRESCQGHAD